MPQIHQIVYYWDGLKCVAKGEQVHFRAQANKLDDPIAFGFGFEVAHLSGVEISITSSDIRKVPITYLAKIKSVSNIRAEIISLARSSTSK